MIKLHRDLLGIMRARIQHRGRHALLLGEVEGRSVRIPVPNTPSDWRAGRNLAADFRRAVTGRQD